MTLKFNSVNQMWDFIDTYVKNNYSANNVTLELKVYENQEEIKKLYNQYVSK